MLIDILTRSIVLSSFFFFFCSLSFLPSLAFFLFLSNWKKVLSPFSCVAVWYSHIFSLVQPHFLPPLLLLSRCVCLHLSERQGLILSCRPVHSPILPLSPSATHLSSFLLPPPCLWLFKPAKGWSISAVFLAFIIAILSCLLFSLFSVVRMIQMSLTGSEYVWTQLQIKSILHLLLVPTSLQHSHITAFSSSLRLVSVCRSVSTKFKYTLASTHGNSPSLLDLWLHYWSRRSWPVSLPDNSKGKLWEFELSCDILLLIPKGKAWESVGKLQSGASGRRGSSILLEDTPAEPVLQWCRSTVALRKPGELK